MRGTMIRTGATLCALLATLNAQAQTAPPVQACVSEPEARAALLTGAPAALHVIERVCGPQLKEDAFLLSPKGKAMLERYEDAGAKAFAQYPDAFAKATKAPGGITKQADIDTTVETILEPVLGKIDAKSCGYVDRLLGLLDPLPPENFTGIFTLAFEAFSGDGKKSPPPIVICNAEGS